MRDRPIKSHGKDVARPTSTSCIWKPGGTLEAPRQSKRRVEPHSRLGSPLHSCGVDNDPTRPGQPAWRDGSVMYRLLAPGRIFCAKRIPIAGDRAPPLTTGLTKGLLETSFDERQQQLLLNCTKHHLEHLKQEKDGVASLAQTAAHPFLHQPARAQRRR